MKFEKFGKFGKFGKFEKFGKFGKFEKFGKNHVKFDIKIYKKIHIKSYENTYKSIYDGHFCYYLQHFGGVGWGVFYLRNIFRQQYPTPPPQSAVNNSKNGHHIWNYLCFYMILYGV